MRQEFAKPRKSCGTIDGNELEEVFVQDDTTTLAHSVITCYVGTYFTNSVKNDYKKLPTRNIFFSCDRYSFRVELPPFTAYMYEYHGQ